MTDPSVPVLIVGGGGGRPLMDLVRPGRFLLIVGEKGAAWCEAAERLGEGAGASARRDPDRARGRRVPRPALQLDAYDALDADGPGAIDRRSAAVLFPKFAQPTG